MEKVCEELDDAKAEIEKLRANLKTKVEIYENLKKAYNEQLVQSQEARSKIERMVQEQNEKSEELSVVKKTCEDLECRLNEKDSLARHLSVTNDKLKVDCNEKSGRWEEEKRGLVLAIEEANEKNVHQEQKLQGYVVEIEGLKELLTASQKRCLEAEKNAKTSKELRQREDFVLKLEEENQNVKDQLKWKKEQFKHLEEAHEKLKCQFKESKKEWEKEKATLVDEICSLQGRLDSQIRISEDLQNRLKMCNQALAHEESRRKQLEVELSEFRAQFDDVFSECQEAKSQLECLTNQQGNDIGALRHALATKEIILKETGYQLRKLEEENKELLESLKELREAQIQGAGSSSSLGKLRNKLRSLEQMHRDCPSIIKAKEAEWSAQMEKLTGELNSYMSALESKETELKRLEVELENCRSVIMRMKLEKEHEGTSVKEHEMQLEHCHSEIMQLKLESESRETAVKRLRMELENCRSAMILLELENVEAAVMLLVLKSEITEAQMRLEKTQAEIDQYNEGREEEINLLVKELEMKNIALSKALKCAKDESEKVAFLSEKDEALKLLEVENKTLSQALEVSKEDYEKTATLLKRDQEKFQQIREELNKVNAELVAKAAFLSEKDEALKLLEVKNKALSQALEASKEDYERTTTLLKRDEGKIQQICEELNKVNTELVAKAAFLSEKDEALKLLEVKNKALSQALEASKEDYERTTTLLKRDEGKIQQICEELNKVNTELAEKDTFLSEKDEALKLLEVENKALSQALEASKEDYERTATLLKRDEGKLQQIREELNKVNTELAEKDTFLTEKDEALKLLEVENKALSQALEVSKEDYERTATLLKKDEGKLQQIREELNKVNTELAAKACETHAVEFELWIWKSITQRLKNELEESHALRKQLEASLLAQVAVGETFRQEKDGFARMLEEKDRRIDVLQQQIELADQELKARESVFTSAQTETTSSFESEKESFLHTIREKDQFLEDLNKEIEWLEEESLRKEFEGALLTQMTAERTFKVEKENLIRVLENKDQRIDDLLQQVNLLEEKFNSSLISFSSELFKKQEEISVLHEAWEKIAAAEILAQLEIEEKKLMILEMEEDINSVKQKLKSQEKALCCSQQQAMEIEAALEAKQFEMLKLSNLMETKLRTSEAMVSELKSEKRNLIENVTRLSSERENLLGLVTTLGDRISQCSDEDLQLMGTLEKIVQSFDNNGSCQVQKISNEAYDQIKENMNIHTPPSTKNLQAVLEVRSPFRQVN